LINDCVYGGCGAVGGWLVVRIWVDWRGLAYACVIK